ncbi:MAG: NirD/YgiW/YdeI family stress tolerance protein [Treponema sp.]|nr:NirD/YgiW/YdeI family stress tolerance protein [Treponema sp.]
MKRNAALLIGILMILGSVAVHAQMGGFTGPQVFGQVPAGFAGQQGFGFMGTMGPVSVAQVTQTFPNKAQAVMRGYIVQQVANDRYIFRDATGDILIKIKHDRWWGLSVGPNDLVEIGGELKREKNMWIKYFDAKNIRLAP